MVFDFRVPMNRGQAVVMSALAELVPAVDSDRCLTGLSRSGQDNPEVQGEEGAAAKDRFVL